MDNVQQLCDRYRPWFQDAFERFALGDRFDWELFFAMLTATNPLGVQVQQPGFVLYVQTPAASSVTPGSSMSPAHRRPCSTFHWPRQASWPGLSS